jgi:hypothetical protein
LVFCDVGASGRRIEETARRNPFVRFAIEYMFDELDERPAPRVVEIKGFAAWNDTLWSMIPSSLCSISPQTPQSTSAPVASGRPVIMKQSTLSPSGAVVPTMNP